MTMMSQSETPAVPDTDTEAPKKKLKAPEERLTDLNLHEISPYFRDFMDKFGLHDAVTMTRCGLYRVDRPEKNDPFLDCVNVAIAYECLTVYYGLNGFKSDPSDVQNWVKENFPYDLYHEDDDAMSNVFKATYKDYLGL
ncbi:MAG: hypothetical protein PHW63_11140 [Alphaproteobacteria bacterium]|nr:hypothetical protein [Alphaproteobacteria bacterium]